MIASIIWLVVGLVLILAGANALTDGASAIARRFGISDLVVGLTVVAFGTSAPELAISIVSAADGSAALAVGNVIGSNIFNILAIIGITAMVRPLRITRSVMSAEIPMVILSSVIVWVMGNALLLDGTQPVVSRVLGIFLLIFFLLFMRYTLRGVRHASAGNEPTGDAAKKGMPMWRATVFTLAGLAALVWGGDKFVDGAAGIARAMGVSEATIGLTVVAIGTSLPELAASVVAAIKREPGLAIGNVIGSNIFNVLLVLGSAAVVAPLPFEGVTQVDLGVLVGASVLFWVFGWVIRRRTITRAEGVVMAAAYVAYLWWLVANA